MSVRFHSNEVLGFHHYRVVLRVLGPSFTDLDGLSECWACRCWLVWVKAGIQDLVRGV